MNKEQIIIDGVNIIGTIDEWARLVAHEWGTDEYSDAEIVKNYILDINKQLARKTQECEELKEKYKNVLNLAKQNADANEYCLQELEQENYRYRKALEEIEKFTKKHCDYWCEHHRILDIINKVKGDNR